MNIRNMGFKKSTGAIMAMVVVLAWTYWAYTFFYNVYGQKYFVMYMFVLSFVPQMRDIISQARLTIIHSDTDEIWEKGLCLMPTPFPFLYMLRIEFPFGLDLEKEYYEQTNVPEKNVPSYNNRRDDMVGMHSIALSKDSSEKIIALNTISRFFNSLFIDPNEVRLKFYKIYVWMLLMFIPVAFVAKTLANNFDVFATYIKAESIVGGCIIIPKNKYAELSIYSKPKNVEAVARTENVTIIQNTIFDPVYNWKNVSESLPDTQTGYIYKNPVIVLFEKGEERMVCF